MTVSQVAKEMPNGGINEAGLVVEQTTLWTSVYPEALERPAIGELQWIQLMLDTCTSVNEVIGAAGQVRIINPMSRLHYLVCDQAPWHLLEPRFCFKLWAGKEVATVVIL